MYSSDLREEGLEKIHKTVAVSVLAVVPLGIARSILPNLARQQEHESLCIEDQVPRNTNTANREDLTSHPLCGAFHVSAQREQTPA